MRYVVSCLISLLFASQVRAVVLAAREDRNTRAPSGSLAGSGWQWEGRFNQFLGTPISRKYFITAGHIGGQIGDPLILNGRKYVTIATYDDPESDLQIWQIHGRFDSWAPLFKDNSEVGRQIMIFGRGATRGDAVVVNGQLKGWRWGAWDTVESWGKNIIDGTGPAPANAEANPITLDGDQIRWAFDRDGIGHEAAISIGDSGGGVFVKNGKLWRLAGINSTVESKFALPGSSDLGDGTFFDVGGLSNGSQIIPDTTQDIPQHSYATRISSRVDWIYSVLGGEIQPSVGARPAPGVPEPTGLALLGSLLLLARRPR